MIRATYLVSAIALAATLAVSGDSYTQERQRTPDAIDREIAPRFRGRVCVAHLEVDRAGAHLRVNHILVLIGPLPMDGSYLVIPAAGAAASDPLAWDSAPLIANATGLAGGTIFLINEVSVREEPGEHPDSTDHPIIMEITEMVDGCPKQAEFHGYPHHGTLGFHGGRAHAG